jgi:CHASE2 domain-containing sensor protein
MARNCQSGKKIKWKKLLSITAGRVVILFALIFFVFYVGKWIGIIPTVLVLTIFAWLINKYSK